MAVNSAQATGFRHLRFGSIDEVLSEIDRIAEADRDGRLETLGNWTAGQILAHISNWIDYGYNGFPMGKPPWILRFLLGFMLKGYLKKGMPRGVRIPGTPEGTFGMDDVSTAEGVERLKRSFQRLKNGEACSFDSPAFGPMSHENRVLLNLRHAELHMGYLRY